MNKLIYFIVSILSFSVTLYSQNVNSSFFLDKWSQRNTLNAAFVPANGQFSLPLIGGFNFYSTGNAGLSNFVYTNDSELVTFLHSSVSGSEFIKRLEPDTYLRQNLDLNMLSFGFFIRKSYFSFGITLKENFNVNVPLDLFKLIKLGFVSENNSYNLRNMWAEQKNITEYSFGYSHALNPKIRIGVHAKYLSGISLLNIKYSKFDILLSGNKVEIDAVGELNLMSDFLSLKLDENNNFQFQNYNFNFANENPAGSGVAFDLGVEYNPTNKLGFSLALNDLGVMNWKAATHLKGVAENNVVFTGFNFDNYEELDIENQLDQLSDDLKKLIQFEKQDGDFQGLSESIPFTINMSAEYSLWGNKTRDISFGLLWNSYNASGYHRNTIMSAVTFKPISWFTLSTSYALVSRDISKLGLAINISPEWINVFIATDFITTKINSQYLPIDKFSLNLQAGISFLLGK